MRLNSLLAGLGLSLFLASAFPALSFAQDFRRGDFDGNGIVEPVLDFHYFTGNWDFATQTLATTCEDAADFNDDGVIELQDALDLLANWWAFGNPGILSPPGVLNCGPDPTADALTCVAYDCTPDPPPPPFPGSLTISALSGEVLDEVTATITFDQPLLVSGFSLSVCHDPAFVELLSLGAGPDLSLDPPANLYFHLDPSGTGFEVAYTSDLFGLLPLPPATRDILQPVYRLLAVGNTELEFCDTIGVLPLPPRVIQDDGMPYSIPNSPGLVTISPPPVLNDDCGDAAPIAVGTSFFSTVGATSDGPTFTSGCTLFGSIEDNVWYEFPLPCSGTVEVTVTSAEFSPRIAIYGQPGCPASVADLLGCADATSTPNPDEAVLAVSGQVGQIFRIEIGSDGVGAGLGEIQVTCTPPPSFQLLTELDPPVANDDGFHGQAVAISGDTMAISEMRDDTFVTRGGAVHLYEKVGSDWLPTQTITLNPPVAQAQFGFSLALEGDTLAVGMAGLDPLLASDVFIYRRAAGTWVLDQILTEPPNQPSFGGSLDLSGSVLAIGGASTESVYLYRDSGGFFLEDQVTTSDPLSFQFGWEVAVEGDLLLASSVGADSGRGRGYLFEFNGIDWLEIATLAATDGEPSDFLGIDVALADGVAFLGAPLHDAACPASLTCESGAVYVFEKVGGTWIETAKVEPALPAAGELFGTRLVAWSGSEFVAGSAGGVDQPGAVHFFERAGNTWAPTQLLTSTAPNPQAGYGFALAGTETDLVVGAPQDDLLGIDAGRALVYERVGMASGNDFVRADCNQDGSRNIADAVFALSFLFPPPAGAPAVNCLDACDANDDGSVNIADAIGILSSLFSTPPVVIPAPVSCGPDPVADALGCAIYTPCP